MSKCTPFTPESPRWGSWATLKALSIPLPLSNYFTPAWYTHSENANTLTPWSTQLF